MKKVKFYRLDQPTDEQEIGFWPQIDDLQDLTRKDLDDFSALKGVDKIPSSFPRLMDFVLHNSALITDVFSSRFIACHLGLIASHHVMKILQAYNLESTTIRVVGFKPELSSLEYKLLFVAPAHDIIQFPESVFLETSGAGTKEFGEHKFKSAEDFQENYYKVVSSITHGLKPTTIILNKNVDLLRVPEDYDGLHISQRLADSLVENNVSGITIIESDIEFLIS